jgi:hypothetical protein
MLKMRDFYGIVLEEHWWAMRLDLWPWPCLLASSETSFYPLLLSLRLSSGPLVVRLNSEGREAFSEFSLLLVILTLVSPLLLILLSGPRLKRQLGAGDSLIYPRFGEQLDADAREWSTGNRVSFGPFISKFSLVFHYPIIPDVCRRVYSHRGLAWAHRPENGTTTFYRTGLCLGVPCLIIVGSLFDTHVVF